MVTFYFIILGRDPGNYGHSGECVNCYQPACWGSQYLDRVGPLYGTLSGLPRYRFAMRYEKQDQSINPSWGSTLVIETRHQVKYNHF